MLLQNPQLAYALLQAQIVMQIVEPQVATVCINVFPTLKFVLILLIVFHCNDCFISCLTPTLSYIKKKLFITINMNINALIALKYFTFCIFISVGCNA